MKTIKSTVLIHSTILMISGIGTCALAQSNETAPAANQLPEINVTAKRVERNVIVDSPASVGAVKLIGANELNKVAAATFDDVMQRTGQGSVDAGGAFGITSGSSMRGFAVQKLLGVSSSKILLNGHPDVADSFNRDLSTLERIEATGGFDSTLIGAGNPGGTVQFQTKQPRGKELTELGVAAGSDGLKRIVIDSEKDFESLRLRLVLASQRGQKTGEGVTTDRDNFLLSSKLATPLGQFRLDTEYANSKAPFVFGTFYANGQFQYDKPYVSPQSTAKRQTKRVALYWEDSIGEDIFAKAWLQHATVNRNESLVGFWSPSNDILSDGYYRPLDSDYRQRDMGVLLKTTQAIGGMDHNLTFSANRQTQKLDFIGPESIAEYSINIQNPVWPVDVSTLPMTPYTYRGQKTESGIGVADAIGLNDQWQLRLGVRHSKASIQQTEYPISPEQTIDTSHWTHSEALVYQATAADKWWISRASSFLPALGLTKDGSVLPPMTASQFELGYAHQAKSYAGSLSFFDIEQKNLPGTDPSNKNFLIPIGKVRSKGATLTAKTDALGLSWQLSTTYQTVRNTQPTRATQGVYVAGVPQVIGSFTLSTPEAEQGMGAWLTASGAGKRAADSQASLSAPGYVRWDAGLTYKQSGWRLSATLQNLFDLRYIQSLSASDNAWQGPRRQLQLGATYQF